MKQKKFENPFYYEAAVDITDEELIEYYVEDHNYSRFIQSSRNIFLVGERGSGKSMTLLYNSYQKQKCKSNLDNISFDFSTIGIYIPCTNSLFFKKDHELVSNAFKISVISEHYLVLSISYRLAEVLSLIGDLLTELEESRIKIELEYVLNIKLPPNNPIFKGLALYIDKLTTETQEKVNNSEDSFSRNCVSFYSFIIPIIRIAKTIPKIRNSHFLFLIDDAHDLNAHQIRTLNSWIAYRDHTDFSFKVAIAKVRNHSYLTANGSSILEGHDFLKIDLEKPYQSKFTDFGMWAKDIVERRLEKFGVGKIDVNNYFPVNARIEKELEECRIIAKNKAEEIYSDLSDSKRNKKISDYVYKYYRVIFFKRRSSKANLPPYSGWETVVHLSTGVVRNLLYPCYWMYDKEYSTLSDTAISSKSEIKILQIRSSYQDEVIKEKSQEIWNRIKKDLFNTIQDCSTEQGIQVNNLFEKLVELFRERLYSDVSEPRAITFTISAWDKLTKDQSLEFSNLLRISKEAQLLYERESSAKEAGGYSFP